jgi:hypothetical protein
LHPCGDEGRVDFMKSRLAAELGYGRISKLYLPLAVSWWLMMMDVPVLNLFLARAPEAELSLAAFGVANSLVFMLEAPIYMMLELSIALSSSRSAFRTLRRFYIVAGLGLTALGLLVLYTPLWRILLQDVMGIPESIAPAAAGTLRILMWWVFPIGWRRVYQGVLVREGQSVIIGVGTVVRLAVLGVSMYVGQALIPLPAAYVGALAAGLGVLAETTLIHLVARFSIRQRLPDSEDSPDSLDFRRLWSLFLPLAMTSVLFQVIPPLVTAGVASAPLAELSLAAWPVAWGLATIFWAPALALRQVSVALAHNRGAWRKVSRFVALTGLALSGTLGLMGLTPLLYVVLEHLLGVSGQVASLAAPAVRIMILLPLGYSLHSLYAGLLVLQSHPRTLRTAKILNVAIVGAILLMGLLCGRVQGASLGALALTTGTVIEAAWLWRKSRTVVQSLPSVPKELAN